MNNTREQTPSPPIQQTPQVCRRFPFPSLAIALVFSCDCSNQAFWYRSEFEMEFRSTQVVQFERELTVVVNSLRWSAFGCGLHTV
eukprot:8225398-Heterocapsa_arctica.AAC.1